MLTKCSHIMTCLMSLLLEHMRMQRCRRMIGQQLLQQFIKCTKFGHLINQIEHLLQQFHQVFFSSFCGVTFKGNPKLTLDCGDVQYSVGGAFHKAMRKTADEDKYINARCRVRDEDAESSAYVIHQTEIGIMENLASYSSVDFKSAVDKTIREANSSGMVIIW